MRLGAFFIASSPGHVQNLRAARWNMPDETKPTEDQQEEKSSYEDSQGEWCYIPYTVTSFTDLEALEEAKKQAAMMLDRSRQFSAIVENIFTDEEITDKAAAVTSLANEFAALVQEPPAEKERWQPLTNAAKGLVKKVLGQSDPEPEIKEEVSPRLHIWKENGQYHWLAAYTNNYRDSDNPPEILTAESHKEFDQALQKGEWPMPEAWLWHVPYSVGQTHYHAYDESTGFCIAGGTFDKDKGWAAEGLVNAGWDGVSHGMPPAEIERDPDDDTLITRRRTKEITFLPQWAAANKLAFSIIKESGMDEKGLPAHKLEEFKKAFGTARVEEIEATISGKAKEATEAGIEQKEQGEGAPQPEPITANALATAIASGIKEAVGPLAQQVANLEAQVKELQRSDEDKITDKAAGLPQASLEALVAEKLGGGLFSKENQVDGRSSLVKSGPKETPVNSQENGLFFFPWLQVGGSNE